MKKENKNAQVVSTCKVLFGKVKADTRSINGLCGAVANSIFNVSASSSDELVGIRTERALKNALKARVYENAVRSCGYNGTPAVWYTDDEIKALQLGGVVLKTATSVDGIASGGTETKVVGGLRYTLERLSDEYRDAKRGEVVYKDMRYKVQRTDKKGVPVVKADGTPSYETKMRKVVDHIDYVNVSERPYKRMIYSLSDVEKAFTDIAIEYAELKAAKKKSLADAEIAEKKRDEQAKRIMQEGMTEKPKRGKRNGK